MKQGSLGFQCKTNDQPMVVCYQVKPNDGWLYFGIT